MLDFDVLEKKNGLFYALKNGDLIKKIYNIMIELNIEIPNFNPQIPLEQNDFLFEIFDDIDNAATGCPTIAHSAIKIKNDIVVGKILGGPVIIHRARDLLGESYKEIKGLE